MKTRTIGAALAALLLSACGGVSASRLNANNWIIETSNSSWACFLRFQLDGDLRRNCETAAGTQWLNGTWGLEGDRIRLTFADGREQTCSFSFEETSIVFGSGCEYQGRWYSYEEFKRRTGRS